MPALAYDRSSRRFDGDGRMHVDNCNIGRACVSPYFGREIPNHKALGLHRDRIYRMYRDPAELERAADSFANLPLLIKHEATTAEKPAQDLWVGTVGSSVKYSDGYLVTDTLSVWTDEAIGLVISGKQQQLSPSYNYRPDMTAGIAPDGSAYDGVMRDIRGNHVAIVETGRQGPTVVVADSHPSGATRMHRFPKLIAAMAAVLPAATPEQLVAFDAALAADMGLDCDLPPDERKAAEDAWRAGKGMAADGAMSDADRKAAYDSWKINKRPAPAGGAPNPASDAKPLTQADLDAAVTKARADARADNTALNAAQRACEPVIGIVAMDNADDVYRAALTKLNVDHKDVHASALPAMFALASRPQAAVVVRPTFDAANRANVRTVVPFLNNVNVR